MRQINKPKFFVDFGSFVQQYSFIIIKLQMERLFSNPLQAIRSKIEVLPVMKLKYFDCQKGGLHDGQVLNYVCIQKGCKQIGLICSVCKNDHTRHNVTPLKYFLSKLKQHKQETAIESQSFQKELQQLQNLKNTFLYDLKQTVQQLAQKIQQVQQHIIEKFKKQKIQLLSQIEIKMRFNEIIESTINNDFSDQISFERDFKLIAGSVEVRNDTKNQIGQKKNDLYFNASLDKIVTDYQTSYKEFNLNLNKFFLDSAKSLDNLMSNQATIIQQNIPKKQQEELKPVKNEGYTFNSLQRGSNIKISDDKKTAECIKSSNQRFALIDGTVLKKGSTIRFKIQKLKNWVGLGLAVRDTIKGKKFQFQYNTLGHGSYLLSNNSYMWSHTSSAHNIQNSDFVFLAGQVIKLEVTEKQLIYTNESDKKEKRIPISLTEHEWTQACFCVNLCSDGDAATIV